MGLLKGLKMLDLSRLLPGPYCSLLLADLGMEVFKIEDPEMGDYMRVMGPARKKTAPISYALNRNKKSMILNLKVKEGKEIFYKFIDTYDILLEGFRPGVMDRLGIGYQELKKRNPRVIFCSLSGYGQDGPYRERSGHDINYIGLGGILELTGPKRVDPIIPGTQIADIGGGGMMAAIAILAAIVHREKTGEGNTSMSLCTTASSPGSPFMRENILWIKNSQNGGRCIFLEGMPVIRSIPPRTEDTCLWEHSNLNSG